MGLVLRGYGLNGIWRQQSGERLSESIRILFPLLTFSSAKFVLYRFSGSVCGPDNLKLDQFTECESGLATKVFVQTTFLEVWSTSQMPCTDISRGH